MHFKVTSTLVGRITTHACLLALIAVCGCSSKGNEPPLGQVSGTVTLDKAPLSDAKVVFQPAQGSLSVGITDKAGKYVLGYRDGVNGAVLGSHQVQITKFPEAGAPKEFQNLVPEKYNQNSPLTAEVKAGNNTFNFDLESK